MLRILKVTVTLATSNFYELYATKFESKSSWVEEKYFSQEIYYEKTERGQNAPPPPPWVK